MVEQNLARPLPLWTVVPFVGLLLSIALLPLKAPHFWERHRNKALVAGLWALPVAVLFAVAMLVVGVIVFWVGVYMVTTLIMGWAGYFAR